MLRLYTPGSSIVLGRSLETSWKRCREQPYRNGKRGFEGLGGGGEGSYKLWYTFKKMLNISIQTTKIIWDNTLPYED